MTDDPQAIREMLRSVGATYDETGAAHDQAAEEREELVVRALRAGIRQTDIARDIGKAREIVRRIARRHGIGC